MKKKTRDIWNVIQGLLMCIGLICLLIALLVKNPVWTLVCAGGGLLCWLPWIISFLVSMGKNRLTGLKKWIQVLEYVIGVCGGSFYVVLIAMKVLHGFHCSIPDWVAVVWLGFMGVALVAVGIREYLQKKIVPQKSQPEQQEPKQKVSPAVPAQKPNPAELEPLLLDGPQAPSYGETQLYELTLRMTGNQPEVLWSVTWRGGYSHADGAGDIIPIPMDILAQQNPDSLIAWIKTVIPEATIALVNWEKVRAESEIAKWLSKALKKSQGRAQAMEQKLKAALGEFWEWSEFGVWVKWNETDGYQLLLQPDRSPVRTILKTPDEDTFFRWVLLDLASSKPDGVKKISRYFTPLDENRWAGRAEHGTQRLYLEKRNQEEYLLWYLAQDFDTQTELKPVGETFDFRIITASTQREYSAEEFLEAVGLREKWGSWAADSLSTDLRFIKLFVRSDMKMLDYPVPFTKLIIYPDGVPYQKKNALQILQHHKTVSYGTRYESRVSLYGHGGQYELTCERYERGSFGSQNDWEGMCHAWLSWKVDPVHHIPLTNWIQSLQLQKLRPYADRVYVTINEPQAEGDGRDIFLKSSRNTLSHNLPGWNCIYDDIFLRFGGESGWLLCRHGIWQESPSGLPYRVFIEMRLLPDMEKEAHEALCDAIESLPWGDPNQADQSTQILRNWMDVEYLHRQVEFYAPQVQANPMSYASSALDEVQTQLRLLGTT